MAAFGALTFSVICSIRTQPQESAQTPPSNGWRTRVADEAMANQANELEPLRVANWMGNTNPGAPVPTWPSSFSSSARDHTVKVSYASP